MVHLPSRGTLAALGVLVLLGGAAPSPALAQPFPGVRLQGTLTDSAGTPLEGPIDITVRIYDVSVAGTPLYAESFHLTMSGGVLDVVLGAGAGTPSGDLLSALTPPPGEPYDRYLTMVVDSEGEEFSPRRRLTAGAAAAFAAHAAVADSLGGLPPSDWAQLTTTGGQTFQGPLTFMDSTTFGASPTMPSATFTEPSGPPFTVASTTRVPNLNAATAGFSDFAVSAADAFRAGELYGHARGIGDSRGCFVDGGFGFLDCSRCLDTLGQDTCEVSFQLPYPDAGWMILGRYNHLGLPGLLEVRLGQDVIACDPGTAGTFAIELLVGDDQGFPAPPRWPSLVLRNPLSPALKWQGTASVQPAAAAPVHQAPLEAAIDMTLLPDGPYLVYASAFTLSGGGNCHLMRTAFEIRFTPGVQTYDPTP